MKKRRYPVVKVRTSDIIIDFLGVALFTCCFISFLTTKNKNVIELLILSFFCICCLTHGILSCCKIPVCAYCITNGKITLDFCGIPYEECEMQELNTIYLCYFCPRIGNNRYIKMICAKSKHEQTEYPVESGVVYVKKKTPYWGERDGSRFGRDLNLYFRAEVLKELLAESGATLFVYQDALKAMSKKDRELLGLRAN